MSFQVAEHDRMLANMLIAGTVAAADSSNGLVKVTSDGWTSDWMPWMAVAAGQARHWRVPSIGEQALILSPSGDPEQGFALTGFYTDRHGRDGRENVVAWSMPDGSVMEYDFSASTLIVSGTSNITIVNSGPVSVQCETAQITAGSSITLDTPETICTGDLIVRGSSVQHAGHEIGALHTHGGVIKGADITGVVT